MFGIIRRLFSVQPVHQNPQHRTSPGAPQPPAVRYPTAPLPYLPDEIWLNILRRVPQRDLIKLQRVSQRVRGLASDDTIWRDLTPSPLRRSLREAGIPFGVGFRNRVRAMGKAERDTLAYLWGVGAHANERHRHGSVATSYPNNFDIVLAGVQRGCGFILGKVNAELRKDPAIVLPVIGANAIFFRDADMSLRNDGAFVMQAVAINGAVFEHAGEDLKRNRDYVLGIVKVFGLALQWVHPNLQDDPEVVDAAMGQNIMAICYAGPTCKSDPERVMRAVRAYGMVLEVVDPAFTKLRNFVMAAVTESGRILSICPDFQDDFEVALTAVEHDYFAIYSVGPTLRDDPIIKAAADKARRWSEWRTVLDERLRLQGTDPARRQAIIADGTGTQPVAVRMRALCARWNLVGIDA